MARFTYVYIRDPESAGCCSACVEHIKEDEKVNLRVAFSFCSPSEKHFNRKISRAKATERMEAGESVVFEKRKGKNTYYAVRDYLKYALNKIDNDEATAEELLKIKSYKVGKNPCLTSEFWGWLFLFTERV